MSKRFISLALTVVILFVDVMGRVGYICLSKAYTVNDSYNSYSINIGDLYPYIYDRKGEALNNKTYTHIAVMLPNEKCLNELDKLFDSNEVADITEELSKGKPIKKEIDRVVNCDHIKIYRKIVENSDDMLCKHMLNYEYGGLEKYIRNKIGELYVNIPTDATGRVLDSNNAELINNNYDSTDGFVISIDKDIQEICEQASTSLNKGAIVVMDVNTSQILASVSLGGDYINRSLSKYAIGSIFKLIACACALENGYDLKYICSGSIKVGDTTFSCQNNHKHGMQNMKTALANSCNCYFVNLALKMGADKLYSTAKAFGFGEDYYIYKNWMIHGGDMPDQNDLLSMGELSLFAFGQGKITDSPAHFASALACIANEGYYNYPTIDIPDNNKINKNKIISNDTSKTLMSYMHYVVTDGTGANANYNNKTAGKTATAQSGIYNNQKEILNTWFAGIYPYNNPKYSIVIMCENGKSGAEDCCPIFRTIVEKLEKM